MINGIGLTHVPEEGEITGVEMEVALMTGGSNLKGIFPPTTFNGKNALFRPDWTAWCLMQCSIPLQFTADPTWLLTSYPAWLYKEDVGP